MLTEDVFCLKNGGNPIAKYYFSMLHTDVLRTLGALQGCRRSTSEKIVWFLEQLSTNPCTPSDSFMNTRDLIETIILMSNGKISTKVSFVVFIIFEFDTLSSKMLNSLKIRTKN